MSASRFKITRDFINAEYLKCNLARLTGFHKIDTVYWDIN